MFARTWRFFAAASLLCILSLLSPPAWAQVTVGGDPGQVSPSDPNTWTNSDPYIFPGGTTGRVGIDPGKSGTITVSTSRRLMSYECYLGYAAGSSGTITVDGLNADWTNNQYGSVYIGYQGTGTLNVQNKGKAFTRNTYVGGWYGMGGTGIVNVSGAGSVWNNGSLNVSGASTITVSGGGQVITNYSAQVSGSGNMVTVTGAGSTWTDSGYLYLYGAGSGNTLTVSGGGKVTDLAAVLSGGTALVTGAGSTWATSGSVRVVAGTSSLRVDNGGTVTAGAIYASLSDLQGDGTITAKGLVSDVDLVLDATHGVNQAFSFGTGGVLNLNLDGTGDLGAGYAGTGTLRIANGVKITSVGGSVGNYAGSTGTATVTGAGSTWTSSSLTVGGAGAGALNVADGGTVTTGALYAAPGSLQGDGTINATALVADMDVVFDATHGTSQVLPFGTGGALNLNWDDTGPLGAGSLRIAEGVKINSSSGYVGYYAGTTSTAVVTGPGSTWSNTADLYVGYAGTGTLRVENGGTVSGPGSYDSGDIGCRSGSNGTIIVTDPGSSWSSSGYITLGSVGTGTLIVQNGGKVNTRACVLGNTGDSSGTATVTGPGSTWTTGYIGLQSTGVLTVADGGTVSCTSQYDDSSIDGYSGAGGTATVTGQGSTWTNSRTLYVARYGLGTLNITAGGKVTTPVSYIGYSSTACGTVVVEDAGSIWANSGDLYLGYAGVGKGTLTVRNGGTVTTGTLHGAASDLYGNGTIKTRSLICDMDLVFDATHGPGQAFGTGGTLNINYGGTGDLGVGDRGSGSLRVADGQKLTSIGAYLGYLAGANGTTVITGDGSTWTNGSCYVGNSGVGSLTVDNGGTVTSATGYLGYNAGSSGTATITGAGSTWANSGALRVGNHGLGALNVESGAAASALDAYLGYYTGSRGAINVIGAGSTWTNTGSLYVGYVGAGAGTLRVANGGTVTAKALYACGSDLQGDGTINASGLICDMDLVFDATHGPGQAFGSGGTLNVADGAGDLGVGYRNAGSLRIADGRKRNSRAGYLGYNAGAAGTAVVTGVGSTWTGSSSFYVGYSGAGDLAVAEGGKVSSSWGYLGYNASSTGTATITGAGSAWNSSVTVGNYGAGTLTVADGGTVASNDNCYLGNKANSSGTVTVTGQGSTWTGSSTLYVGYSGLGTLNAADGGTVSGTTGYLGCNAGSGGTATITGAGSAWTNSGKLYVGFGGSGFLTVADGGKVTAQSVSIRSASTANLHVTGNGTLVLGNSATAGSIANAGQVNLYADAFLAAGTYSPITECAGRAITWSGVGSYNAYGGIWDSTAKTFTVPPAMALAAGTADLVSAGQRLLITDSATGHHMGVSFGNALSGNVFVVLPASPGDLSGLPADQSVLAAWKFATDLSSGREMLSFYVGAGESNLEVWQYDGAHWTPFSAPDLTYGSDGIADFTVACSGFCGYAITTAVPEPCSMALLALGGLALLRRRK